MRTGTAALLSSAVLLAGCSSTVVGRVVPTAAGPLAQEVGRVDADAELGSGLEAQDVAATPDGGFVVLFTSEDPLEHSSVLLELAPGDGGGLTAGTATEGGPFAVAEDVQVAADGTVVTTGVVLIEPGDPRRREDPYGQDVVLAVLTPGADEPEVVPVEADPEMDTPDAFSAVLSPDGETLHGVLQWSVDGHLTSRLARVDVATGEVEASAPLGVDEPGQAVEVQVAAHPDGGLVALVTVDRDPAGGGDEVVLARYDADLQPVGEPFDVLEQDPGIGFAVAVLPDGTVLASVLDGGWETGSPRLVTVRDGAVEASTVLAGTAHGLVPEPGGSHVYLSHSWPGGGAGVATVDLATGAVVADVPLCESGSATPPALSADGRTLAAGAACLEVDGYADLVVLVG
ncbi:hypothetical protein GCM10027451_33240 [Geodermatophilus aquaeductus]|uniref:Lactonase, 7-bladed beta-propeller n=1 Tax=Geodermatophilus aquaeductus TaxID=1564161 RepID=A0A521EXH4_9ACTN|nr:hypothetical protein [Geodermatophilus aquaeductus]SMO88596.1 hypothetical protein SAMN06273567_106120 [Geodermatophilus aquaeductus]